MPGGRKDEPFAGKPRWSADVALRPGNDRPQNTNRTEKKKEQNEDMKQRLESGRRKSSESDQNADQHTDVGAIE